MTMIYDWARRRAESAPGQIAISLKDNHLTYGELETQSNRLAGLLIRHDLQPGDRVALLLEKTPDAVIAMHGIGKAGGMYVPIDIHSPATRVEKILISSDVRLMLVDHHAQQLLSELNLLDPRLDNIQKIWWSQQDPGEPWIDQRKLFSFGDLPSEPDHPHAVVRDDQTTAHILFTSGSTGEPKGVPITHRNIRTFVEWGVNWFNMTPDDRVSCHSPLHFDLSTFDIYGAMAAGCRVFIVPPDISVIPGKLSEFILKNELTQWFSVPSALSYMARFKAIPKDGYPSLKRLIWCGEVFPVHSLRYWMKALPGVEFTNLYGPTEATIASSYHTLDAMPAESEDVPIGLACGGEQLWILDEEMQPVKPGDIGDLYISGDGLSPGYWQDPERTADVFRQWTDPDGETLRIYRTGDLASSDHKGRVYYHGRADHQIKSRGYRIELGEIESALDELNVLREFAVVPVNVDGFEGTSIGCAYVPVENSIQSPLQIKRKLTEKIPSYMIPRFWHSWSILPRNGNGKIDRKALSDHFEDQFRPASRTSTASTPSQHHE